MSNQTKAREEGAEYADYRFSLQIQVFLSGEVQENLSLFRRPHYAAKLVTSLMGQSLDPSKD
jgi:hypothetical protein